MSSPRSWRYLLPSASTACLGSAIALDLTSTAQGPLALALGLFVLASVLAGVWVVLLVIERDNEPTKPE